MSRRQKRQIKSHKKRGASKASLLIDLVELFSMEADVPPFICMAALEGPEGEALLKEVGLEGVLKELEEGEEDDEFDLGVPFDLGAIFDSIFEAPEQETENKQAFSSSDDRKQVDDTRITGLRRELAFALHPDQSDSAADPAKLELWHQVQEAVEARDLDRLEVLHAHMQVLSGDLSPLTPVSRLMGLTAMYRSSRDALRRRIRSLRKRVEWGFSAAAPETKARVKEQLARELQSEIRRLR